MALLDILVYPQSRYCALITKLSIQLLQYYTVSVTEPARLLNE